MSPLPDITAENTGACILLWPQRSMAVLQPNVYRDVLDCLDARLEAHLGGGPRTIARLRGTDGPVAMPLNTVAALPTEGLGGVNWKAVTAETIDCEFARVLWDGEQP